MLDWNYISNISHLIEKQILGNISEGRVIATR
jgi:hypothetical protein